MRDVHSHLDEKVDAIFRELAGGERAKYVRSDVPSRCMLQIANAVSSQSGYAEEAGWDIGHHVGDWVGDAAFLVALHLFPERFTDEEIDEGVLGLLIHVPAHVVVAAKLAGYPVEEFLPHDEDEPQDATGGGRPSGAE